MNIAINVKDVINNTEFLEVMKEWIGSGDRVFLMISNDFLLAEENKKALEHIKKRNIRFADAIFFDKETEEDFLRLKNISYLIDSEFDGSKEFKWPVAKLRKIDVPGENYNFEHPNEIRDHVLLYKKRYEERIKDPITVLSGIPSVDKIWTRQYEIDQMTTNVHNMSVYDYVFTNNKDNMDAVALRYFGSTMTFKEMFIQVDRFAKALKAFGIKQGDAVTICMPNTPEGVVAFFATNKIGAKASMLHPLLKSNDILESLQRTGSKYMVMADMCFKEVNKVIDRTIVEKVVVVSPSDSMPIFEGIPFGIKILYRLKGVVERKSEKRKCRKLVRAKRCIPKQYISINNAITNEIEELKQSSKSIPYGSLYTKWEDELNRNQKYNGDISSKYVPGSCAVLLRTGGTTGVSKLASLSNENMISNTSQLRVTIPSYKKGDELLAISPIFHGFGLVDSVITALAVNMSVDLHPQYNKKIFNKALLKNKPTLILGVPTLFKAMISNPIFDGKDLSFMKVLISGGDTLDTKLRGEINEWLRLHGAENPVFCGIGMTETTAAIAFTGLNSVNDLSVGYPLPLNNVKIINPVTLEELSYGEVGELCVSGPTVMKEYYDSENETNAVFLDEDRKWLRTGDICYLTENGEICFVDRNKNVIIVSGVNVYSNEVEAELLQIPEIDSCAVIGIQHPYKMNVPKAYVVLRKGILLDEELKNKILHCCNSKLDSYHKVYEIEQLDRIPTTNLNKVDYTELRKRHLETLNGLKDR